MSDVDASAAEDEEWLVYSIKLQLAMHEFEGLQWDIGVKLMLDACCSDSGVDAKTAAFCSSYTGKFCDRELADSDIVWLHPHAGEEAQCIEHYLRQKANHPRLSAAVVLPASFACAALAGMQLVKSSPAGLNVLRCKHPDQTWSLKPLTECINVWYDCPGNPHTLPKHQHSLHAAAADGGCFWVLGSIAGRGADRILLDTGASANFLSTACNGCKAGVACQTLPAACCFAKWHCC